MASDWRVLSRPLRRRACRRCGLVQNADRAADPALFVHGYSLYAHAPGDPYEDARQQQYAAWIAAATAAAPASVLDVGCGNGSLLRALGRRWPDAVLMGCDLSVESVAHGRTDGLVLWPVAPDDLPNGLQADLVITVNVVEHVSDPIAFLAALRRRVSPGGHVVIVCPDGAIPGVELLIADHQHSFERAHLEHLAARAGFAPCAWTAAPETLGPFQLLHADVRDVDAVAPVPSPTVLRAKSAWLERWDRLDERLLARLGSDPVVCFGLGEAAGLLRAYAPRVWQRVRACTADTVSSAEGFDGVPVAALGDVPQEATVLVAVRPQDQPSLATRLRPRFRRIITWYDLVDASSGDLPAATVPAAP